MDTSESESDKESDTEISSADPCWYRELCLGICCMVIPEEVNDHSEWKSKIAQKELCYRSIIALFQKKHRPRYRYLQEKE